MRRTPPPPIAGAGKSSGTGLTSARCSPCARHRSGSVCGPKFPQDHRVVFEFTPPDRQWLYEAMNDSPSERSRFSLPAHSLLFTDLYELTMVQAYEAEGMDETAVFELFFRELPPERSYVVAAGLDDVLQYLEGLETSDDEIAFLAEEGAFSREFLDRLRRFRFSGDVNAVPEGTVVFPDEPLVQVIAPLQEAQLIETLVLNQIHFQSVIASKAARVVTAAAGRNVVDFGSRRAHGLDAALKTARASYLTGAAGTSNVLAGKLWGIPIFGTMAHSYIQAHDDERRAFEAFARLYPETTLLVDTYDTLEGVRKVIALSRQLGPSFSVRAIRLDSGDIADLAREARSLLDEAGLRDVQIFASSELDERVIAKWVKRGVPVDAFGVGTRLAVASDAPDLDMAYKLVEYAGRPRTKLSSHKTMYPGRKQVYRVTGEDGRITGDVLTCHDEDHHGEPLLEPVMRGGRRVNAGVLLEDSRTHCQRELARLPQSLLEVEGERPVYAVEVSTGLERRLASFRKSME